MTRPTFDQHGLKSPVNACRHAVLPTCLTFRTRLALVFALQVVGIYMLYRSELFRSAYKNVTPNTSRRFDQREKIISWPALPPTSSNGIHVFSAISTTSTVHVTAWFHQSVRGQLTCCFRLDNGTFASVNVSDRYRYHHNTSLVGSQVICSTARLGVGYNVTVIELQERRPSSVDSPCPSDGSVYISPLHPLRPGARNGQGDHSIDNWKGREDRSINHRGSQITNEDRGDHAIKHDRGSQITKHTIKHDRGSQITKEDRGDQSITRDRGSQITKEDRGDQSITRDRGGPNTNIGGNADSTITDNTKGRKRVNSSTEHNSSNDIEPFSFAICAKILYHNVSPDLLIEWMEYNLRMGADRVIVFTYQLPATTMRIIQYYAQAGFADVRPYDFPLSDYPTRRVGAEDLQVWSDEQVVVFDCQERLGNYKYISILDIDEFIVPHKGIGFERLFNSMQDASPLAAVFRFPMREHVLEWGCNFTTCTNDADTLLVKAHRKFKSVDFNRKVLVRAARVPSGAMWTHDVYSVVPPFTKVDVHNASVSHFRKCRAMWVQLNGCASTGVSDSPTLPALFDKQLRKRVSELKSRFIYSNR